VSTVVPFDPARPRRTRPPSAPPRDVLTVAETARLLRLSINTTYAYLADRAIPGQRIGRRWIISRARLDAWLAGADSDRAVR
jgi:excisionase family DNA binding protein